MLVARLEEAKGDLIAWWEGDDLKEDAQIQCDADEVVVFIDEDGVVASLGPGRHALPELEDLESLAVAFVTTRMTLIEAQGEVEGLEGIVTLTARIRIVDGEKVMPLLDNLNDEESLEDWLAEELLLHAAAATQHTLETADNPNPADGSVIDQTAARANAVLGEFGVEVAPGLTVDIA